MHASPCIHRQNGRAQQTNVETWRGESGAAVNMGSEHTEDTTTTPRTAASKINTTTTTTTTATTTTATTTTKANGWTTGGHMDCRH